MTNTAMLKYFMEIKGFNQTELANELGISKGALNNKVLNKRDFTIKEISKIQEILNLTLEEKEIIFFSKDVLK